MLSQKLTMVAEILAMADCYVGMDAASAEDYLRLIWHLNPYNPHCDSEWGCLYRKAKHKTSQMPRNEDVLLSWAACLKENILIQADAVWVFQMAVWGTLLAHNTVSQQAKDVLMVVQTAFGIPDVCIDAILLIYPFSVRK